MRSEGSESVIDFSNAQSFVWVTSGKRPEEFQTLRWELVAVTEMQCGVGGGCGCT